MSYLDHGLGRRWVAGLTHKSKNMLICRENGNDGTRTRDLRRDRPAL
jgi:hypothetical protein